jgi:hypothetical protein
MVDLGMSSGSVVDGFAQVMPCKPSLATLPELRACIFVGEEYVEK